MSDFIQFKTNHGDVWLRPSAVIGVARETTSAGGVMHEAEKSIAVAVEVPQDLPEEEHAPPPEVPVPPPNEAPPPPPDAWHAVEHDRRPGDRSSGRRARLTRPSGRGNDRER